MLPLMLMVIGTHLIVAHGGHHNAAELLWLGWAGGVEVAKHLDLFGVHVQALGHDDPVDDLVAGRRREGSRVGVEGVEIAGEYVVDGLVVDLLGFLGHVDLGEDIDDRIEVGVALPVRLRRDVVVL